MVIRCNEQSLVSASNKISKILEKRIKGISSWESPIVQGLLFFDKTTIIIWVCPAKIEAFIKYGRIMTEKFGDSTDRRKSARVNIQANVAFFLDNSPGIIQTRISNISEGGALMVTFMRALPVDISIEMSFVLPDKKEEDGRDRQRLITVKGKIRHTRFLEKNFYESGVEFLNLEKKDRLVIRECLASLPKK
jgi:PilZ domain